jgi:arylsulfatase A-like enzyme
VARSGKNVYASVTKTLKAAFPPAAFVAAVAFFWGATEALITHVWGLRAVWRPLDLWESAFDRAVFYLFVTAAVSLLAWGAAFAVKRKRGVAASAPWRHAGVIALAVAANAGWLVLALTARFKFKWWFLAFDVRRPGGFATYWLTLLVAAVGVAAAFGFLSRFLRRRFPKAGALFRVAGTALFVALVAYHVISPLSRPVPRGPDIFLVVLDAWRADAFNRELTPKLMSFAERHAITYRNARATASWTEPSMGSVFTAEYPDEHARRHRMTPLERPPTVARRLSDAGYDTHALNANRLLQRFSYVVDGFDDFYYGGESSLLRAVHFYDTNWYGPAVRRIAKREPTSETSRRLAARLDALAARPGRRPRFVWVHFMDPHTPYAPPPAYYRPSDAAYVNDYRPEIKSRAPAHRRLYDGECRFMDDLLAPILEKTAAKGRAVVILTSDHGEEFWEHKTYEHGKSVYETVLRVPLAIAVPGGPPASFSEPVTLLDLGPTVLDLAGVSKPLSMRGESLLRRPSGEPTLIYAGSKFTESPDYKPERQNCVIWRDWKLILPHDGAPEAGEFYDLRVDPEEKEPLPGKQRLIQTLTFALTAWKETVSAGPAVNVAEDHEAELRALGYIQ